MKIVIKQGPNSGEELEVQGSIVVGRDPEAASFVIDDPEASRRHASIVPSETGVVVEDLASTNGTFVNGERIEGTRDVGAGDEIRIGNTVLEVQSAVEVTRMSPIPEASDPDATAIGVAIPDEPPPAPPAATEPPAAPEPPAPEPPTAAEPPPAPA
ncbi:MAG TPA: FHA domain-containing protein, partial [Thermoleophilaceae bacterium]